MPLLFTIGYQGRDLTSFVQQLRDHGVRYLIDVRESPFSRQRDFSKPRLSSAVGGEGVSYIHIGELGAPRALRQELRSTGDQAAFFRGYADYLRTCPDQLGRVARLIDDGPACLMCLERMPQDCHRKVIADFLSVLKSGVLRVEHI